VADSFAGARVAEISLLGTPAGIGERDALYRALSFIDLSPTVVAHEHCLSSHEITSTIADD
jgi:hypothetical protein